MQNHRDLPFRITKVWAKNFRSIADASVDLDALTLLVGPNASGKSNVLDILRFIKDALRFDLEVAVSMRQGIESIRRRASNGSLRDVEIGVCADVPGYSIEYGFTLVSGTAGIYKVMREYGKIWGINSKTGRPTRYPVEFQVDDGNFVRADFLSSAYFTHDNDNEDAIKDFDANDLAFPVLRRMLRSQSQIKSNRMSRLMSRQKSNKGTIRRLRQKSLLKLKKYERAEARMSLALRRFYKYLLDMRFYHIFPNTIRSPQPLQNERPLDEDAGNLASVLRTMSKEYPEEFAYLKESIAHLIPGVSDIKVVPLGGYLLVRLKRDSIQNGTWFDLSQESDGTVRLLALSVALHQPDISLIGIEEPELTVHPGALAVLADMLNEASLRAQVIGATHSPDLIDCVTDYRHIDNLRVVELMEGITKVNEVSSVQVKAVKKRLFSPGELHRMGELELSK